MLRKLLLSFTAAAGCLAAAAQPEPAVVTVVATETNPGGVPEFSVRLRTDGPSPVAMVLFFAFDRQRLEVDPDYYQFVTEVGNATVTTRGPVRPANALTAAGKVVEADLYEEGALGVAIVGLNELPIPDGELFRVGCRVSEFAQPNTGIEVRGITPELATTVTNINTGQTDLAQSSAVYLDGDVEQDLPVFFFNDAFGLTCGGRFDAPGGLTASTGDPDDVTLDWSSVVGAGVTYRVYRADTPDLADALPLGTGWTSLTELTDPTAAATVEVTTAGCMPMVLDQETPQYYWVVARDDAGCETNYAGPVEGFRGGPAAKQQSAGLVTLADGIVYTALALLLLAHLRKRPQRG